MATFAATSARTIRNTLQLQVIAEAIKEVGCRAGLKGSFVQAFAASEGCVPFGFEAFGYSNSYRGFNYRCLIQRQFRNHLPGVREAGR